jgi:hypothetical protein
MKTVYFTILDVPYKMILTNDKLREITNAQSWLSFTPWNGVLYVKNDATNLNCNKNINVDLEVERDNVSIICVLDDLLHTPDLLVSNSFELLYLNNLISLDTIDNEFVNSWVQNKYVNCVNSK